MFVYQRKINNKDGIVFVSESVDQGKQLPIINGPAYAVYETEDGKIVAESVEFSDGEIDTGNYFYKLQLTLIDPETQETDIKFDKYPKNYVENEPIVEESSSDLTITKSIDSETQHIMMPVLKVGEDEISAITSSGYDLEVTKSEEKWEGYFDVYSLHVSYEGGYVEPSLFFDKEVEGLPATDVILTLVGGSTYTVTWVYDEQG